MRKLFKYEKRLKKLQDTYFCRYELVLDYTLRSNILAYTYGPRTKEIYVSKMALKKLNDDMLLSTLYHEQGHIEDPKFGKHKYRDWIDWILAGNPWNAFLDIETIPAREIYADAYALNKMYWHFRKMKLSKEKIAVRMSPLIDASNAYSGRLARKIFDDSIYYGRSVDYIISKLSPGSLFRSIFPAVFR